MFGNKKKKDQKAYEAKMKEAVQAQRSGKIQRYAELMAEADEILKRIEAAD